MVIHLKADAERSPRTQGTSRWNGSVRLLLPTLEVLLDASAFVIRGWDEDNGSEYVNKRVAKLLDKLLC